MQLYVFSGNLSQVVILANSGLEAWDILKQDVPVYKDYGPWDLDKVVDLDKSVLVAWHAE